MSDPGNAPDPAALPLTYGRADSLWRRLWPRVPRLRWRSGGLLVVAVAAAGMCWKNSAVWQPTVIGPVTTGFSIEPAGALTSAATVSADGRWAAVQIGSKIAIYDSRAGKMSLSLHFPHDLRRLFFSLNGRSLLTRDKSGVIRVFDLINGAKQLEISTSQWQPTCDAAISPDGSRLLINTAGHGELLDCKSGRCIWRSVDQFDGMLFIPNNQWAFVIIQSHLIGLQTSDGKVESYTTFPYRGNYQFQHGDIDYNTDPNIAIVSPDGSALACLNVGPGASQVSLADTQTGTDRTLPLPCPYAIAGVVFSPNGKEVYISRLGPHGAELVRIDAANGKSLTVRVRTPIGFTIGRSPDGKFIALNADTHTALIFDSRTVKPLTQLPGEMDLNRGPFSLDSRWILIRRRAGGMALYDTSTWTPHAAPVQAGQAMWLADNSILMKGAYAVVIWHRHRPEAWWGVAVLWQFWLALLALAAFVISATRDTWKWYHPTLDRRATPAG